MTAANLVVALNGLIDDGEARQAQLLGFEALRHALRPGEAAGQVARIADHHLEHRDG